MDRLGRLGGKQEEWRQPTVRVEGGPEVDDVLRAVVTMHVAPRVSPAAGLVHDAWRVEYDVSGQAGGELLSERGQLLQVFRDGDPPFSGPPHRVVRSRTLGNVIGVRPLGEQLTCQTPAVRDDN